MASVEAHAGANERALALAERAASIPPHHREIHMLLSQLYRRKGDAARTAQEARLLELLPPSQETPWSDTIAAQIGLYSRKVNQVAAQVRSLVGSGDFDNAVRMLDRLAPEDRASPVAKTALALAKARMGNAKEAEELLAALPGDEPNALFARAMVAMLQEKYAEAAERFAKMTNGPIAPEGLRAIDALDFNRGVCLERLGKIDESIAAFEKTLKINPGNLGAILHLCELYLKKDRKADARRLLADAELLAPDDATIKDLQRRAAS
jgi:tetratricopeptide (TPR) repeat protein